MNDEAMTAEMEDEETGPLVVKRFMYVNRKARSEDTSELQSPY